MTFKKFDQDKVKLSLLPWKAIRIVTRVLMFGVEKYGENNWKLCDDRDRYVNAALRHITDYIEGEKKDPETNLSPIAHAICDLLFVLHFELEDEVQAD